MAKLSKKEIEKLVQSLIKVRVDLEPLLAKKASLEELIKEHPGQFSVKNITAVVSDQARKTINWNRARRDLKLDDHLLEPYTETKLIRTLRLLVR
jgi:poly-D-alanine transfer protein DltD